MKEIIKKAFPITIPVMLGYVPLGMAYGLLMQNAGFGLLWSAAGSLAIYSGTAQYVSVEFLRTGAALLEVALVILVLNSRMMFYGLSFLQRFGKMGWKKLYLIFTLSDETYAIISTVKAPEGMDERNFMLTIAALNQSYWLLGTIVGAVAGALIKFDITGIDFIMTALFTVLCMDQWKKYKVHEPALMAAVCSVLSLVIFGPENFMIPALAAILGCLLVRRGAIEKKLEKGAAA